MYSLTYEAEKCKILPSGLNLLQYSSFVFLSRICYHIWSPFILVVHLQRSSVVACVVQQLFTNPKCLNYPWISVSALLCTNAPAYFHKCRLLNCALKIQVFYLFNHFHFCLISGFRNTVRYILPGCVKFYLRSSHFNLDLALLGLSNLCLKLSKCWAFSKKIKQSLQLH